MCNGLTTGILAAKAVEAERRKHEKEIANIGQANDSSLLDRIEGVATKVITVLSLVNQKKTPNVNRQPNQQPAIAAANTDLAIDEIEGTNEMSVALESIANALGPDEFQTLILSLGHKAKEDPEGLKGKLGFIKSFM